MLINKLLYPPFTALKFSLKPGKIMPLSNWSSGTKLNEEKLRPALDALTKEDYDEFLKRARSIGLPIKTAWDAKVAADKTLEKNKFTSNPKFREYLIDIISVDHTDKKGEADTPLPIETIKALKTQLRDLRLFLTVWEDPGLRKEDDKQIRQLIKYKADIDKEDRYSVKIALLALIFSLSQKANELIKQEEESHIYYEKMDLYEKDNIESFKKNTTTEALIEFLIKDINKLNQFISLRYLDPDSKKETVLNNVEKLRQKNMAKIKKIGDAIYSFDRPTKKKKALITLSVFIALLASLGEGISTGGAIYLLFTPLLAIPAIPPLAITLGILVFVVGFIANFRFFVQNFPDFLINLCKKGGVTEFINSEGKREQLSHKKKGGLGIGVIISLCVGVTGATLTGTVLAKFFLALPFALGIIFPHLIAGILAATVFLVLTVSVLSAIITALKKPTPTLDDLKQGFRNKLQQIKNSSMTEKFSNLIQVLLISFALGGLLWFRIVAGIDLSKILSSGGLGWGIAAAAIVSVFAFIAQIPFNILSVNKLKNVLITFSNKIKTSSVSNAIKSIFSMVLLIANAAGNAALVVDNKNLSLSIAGSVGCGINSWGGNIPGQDEQNMIQIKKRAKATEAILDNLSDFEKRLKDSLNSDENNSIKPVKDGSNFIAESSGEEPSITPSLITNKKLPPVEEINYSIPGNSNSNSISFFSATGKEEAVGALQQVTNHSNSGKSCKL